MYCSTQFDIICVYKLSFKMTIPKYQIFPLSQILKTVKASDGMCDALGVPHEEAHNLSTVVDENGNTDDDIHNVTRFIPLSAFKDEFLTFLNETCLSAARRCYSGLFLSISGADGYTPPRDGPRTVHAPVYRLEDAVEGECEEEVQSGPILNYMICLYGLVPESVFQEFGWMSPEEYAMYVYNPSNIVLSICDGKVVSGTFPEYEHVSLPFSAIPQCIRDDMRENGAYFEDEDLFQINIVRAVRG